MTGQKTAGLSGLAVFICASLTQAQSVRVVSEFTRLRPDGEVVTMDRGERVREILSPATARNAYATYRVAVEAPPGQPYTIHIGQNPDDSCEVQIYQENYTRTAGQWVPDGLTRLDLPVNAKLEAGQKIQTYLLDLFIPETTKAGRFRVEVQLWANDRWTIYPLEMRPRAILSPAKAVLRGPVPTLEARADEAIVKPIREMLCKEKTEAGPAPPPSVRSLLVRNIRQDLMIGEGRMPTESFEGVAWNLLRSGGWSGNLKEYCATPQGPAPAGPEWWLRARDYLYQGLPAR